MKKRLVLIVILLVIGVILFLENVCKISVFENIKNTIIEQSQMSSNVKNNVTAIDVTGIVPGEETDHEHLYKTLYDENKHWEECMACGEKRNEKMHTYTRTWASGSESCNKANSYTDTCACGYSFIGHKPCVWNGKSYAEGDGSIHVKLCTVCKQAIAHSYYYNGKLYNDEIKYEYCTYKGKNVNCTNPGTCEKCGGVKTSNYHSIETNIETRKIYCRVCNKVFGTYSHHNIESVGVPARYTIETHIVFENGMTLYSINGMRSMDNPWKTNSSKIKQGAIGGTDVTIITEAEFRPTWKTEYSSYVYIAGNISGRIMYMMLLFDDSGSLIYPDSIQPEIADIVTDNEDTLTTWSRTKPIIVSGTENYCDNVYVKIIDDKGTVFFTGNTVVKNGSYSISCTPELEVDASGKKFKVIVTDACDNKTEQEFDIAKVDAIAPRITSGDELGGDWAKSKKITFSANDYGIGEVQIGFNSSDDYELALQDGESYSREYELFGDVYEPREANVYYKDGLGNISTKKIIIDKLDNTVPTITNVNVHNNNLTIEANDINKTWGEGSGVVKYRYITSSERIENADDSLFTNEVSVEENIVIPNFPEVKYVYVVAEDLVRKCK